MTEHRSSWKTHPVDGIAVTVRATAVSKDSVGEDGDDDSGQKNSAAAEVTDLALPS